jgi:hypothetical protein
MKIIYKYHGFCKGKNYDSWIFPIQKTYIHASDMTDGAILKCTVAFNNALSFAVDGLVPLCTIARSSIDDGPVADVQLVGYVLKSLHCYIQFRNFNHP